VPDDPLGTPGMPTSGSHCFLYARVRNNGTTAVNDAVVKFYWANPAVGFNRLTANFVGQSNVSLNPGQTEDVLCLAPWTPTFVNGGHECVLAEAFHPTQDPLPAAPDFNVPTDRHVAQRNLSVLPTMSGTFALSFEIHNAERKPREFSITWSQEKVTSLKQLGRYLGNGVAPDLKDGKVVHAGFSDERCPTRENIQRAKFALDGVKVAAMGRSFATLIGAIEGDAALIHVTQRYREAVVGGLGILVLHAHQPKAEVSK
jgi:hypothetical protein